MRFLIAVVCSLICVGCAGPRAKTPAGKTEVSRQGQVVMTPDLRPIGKVAMVNTQGRFVVMTFSVGTLPPKNQKLNVYRGGLKVGEVTVSEWARDINVVGDIVAGEAEVSDEVREN